MELYGESSRERTKYAVANRPVKNVGTPFPLSEHSAYLSIDDPLSTALIARKDGEEEARQEAKRRGYADGRQQRHQELARRMCERETVENYIQTPFARQRGNAMGFGFNVINGTTQTIRHARTTPRCAGIKARCCCSLRRAMAHSRTHAHAHADAHAHACHGC
jgi:hypothetical protein